MRGPSGGQEGAVGVPRRLQHCRRVGTELHNQGQSWHTEKGRAKTGPCESDSVNGEPDLWWQRRRGSMTTAQQAWCVPRLAKSCKMLTSH